MYFVKMRPINAVLSHLLRMRRHGPLVFSPIGRPALRAKFCDLGRIKTRCRTVGMMPRPDHAPGFGTRQRISLGVRWNSFCVWNLEAIALPRETPTVKGTAQRVAFDLAADAEVAPLNAGSRHLTHALRPSPHEREPARGRKSFVSPQHRAEARHSMQPRTNRTAFRTKTGSSCRPPFPSFGGTAE